MAGGETMLAQSAPPGSAAGGTIRPHVRLSATGTGAAHAQRTGASRRIADDRPGDERDQDRQPRLADGRAARTRRTIGRRARAKRRRFAREDRPDGHAASGAGGTLLPVTMTSAGPDPGRGRPGRPAHDAAAAPSTVIPSASPSSAWASRSDASDTSRMSSTRPTISARASGTGTRLAIPSANVAAVSVSIGRPAPPRQGHRRRGLGLDPDDPATRRGRLAATRRPRRSARRCRPARRPRPGQRAARRPRPRRSPRRASVPAPIAIRGVLAVDEQEGAARPRRKPRTASRAASKSWPAWIDRRPERAHPVELARGSPARRRRRPPGRRTPGRHSATPWPKLPVEAADERAIGGRLAPPPPARGRRATSRDP